MTESKPIDLDADIKTGPGEAATEASNRLIDGVCAHLFGLYYVELVSLRVRNYNALCCVIVHECATQTGVRCLCMRGYVLGSVHACARVGYEVAYVSEYA